jgi:hypothetical protein
MRWPVGRSAPLTHPLEVLFPDLSLHLPAPVRRQESYCRLSLWDRKTQSCHVRLLLHRPRSATTTWTTGRLCRGQHMHGRNLSCVLMAQATSFREQIQTPTFSKSTACSIAMATINFTTTSQVSRWCVNCVWDITDYVVPGLQVLAPM